MNNLLKVLTPREASLLPINCFNIMQFTENIINGLEHQEFFYRGFNVESHSMQYFLKCYHSENAISTAKGEEDVLVVSWYYNALD